MIRREIMPQADHRKPIIKEIKLDTSKLEKTLKLSSDELIAQAIQDILKRDKDDEFKKK